MTQPNWGLLQGNNALAHFGQGLQLGQHMRDRREYREQQNALLDLRRQQEERLARTEQQQQQQAQETERRNDLPIIAKLLEGAQDEPSYQQALTAAQRYGIDVSDAPQQFDPAWREQTLMIARAAQSQEGQQALSDAGKKAVDAGFKPGTPEFNQAVRQIVTAGLAQPYTGSQGETRLYTPDVFGGGGQAQSGPQPGAVEDGYRFKGGNPADPNNWEPVTQGGGGASGVTSGFLDGL